MNKAEVLEQYNPLICKLARRISSNLQNTIYDYEDCVQDLRMALLHRMDTNYDMGQIVSFIRLVSVAQQDWFMSKHSRQKRIQDKAKIVCDSSCSFEEDTIDHLDFEARKWSKKQSEVLSLKMSGYSFTEISKLLGMTARDVYIIRDGIKEKLTDAYKECKC